MMSPEGKPSSRTIPALVAELATRYPQHEALVGGTVRFSYLELADAVESAARGLMQLGVGRGTHVALLMGNEPEWIIANLAVASLGAVLVSVNTYVTTPELHFILDHAEAEVLIYADRFMKYDYVKLLEELQPLGQKLPRLSKFVHVGASGLKDSVPFSDLAARGRNVSEDAYAALVNQVRADDLAALLYTSGSTSTPKGVQLHHAPLIDNMWDIGNRMHVVPGDRFWAAVSMFWALGCVNLLFNALTHGACIVLQSSFDAGRALRLMEAERCTVFYGTANMVQALVEHPDYASCDLSKLRAGGTLGTPAQMQRAIELVPDISQIYGLTESYGNCNVTDGQADSAALRQTTVGRPLPGFEQRLVNPETGLEVTVGEVGEIQIKGNVTTGYYKAEDKNREAFTADGWFRTGDLGLFDADGYLHFRGRIKELIKTGGINVSPAEVEQVLSRLPGVRLAFVVPVPDERQGELVGAIIVAEDESDRELEATLREALESRLSSYKRPRRYHFTTEALLPLTSTGKIKRADLPRLFED